MSTNRKFFGFLVVIGGVLWLLSAAGKPTTTGSSGAVSAAAANQTDSALSLAPSPTLAQQVSADDTPQQAKVAIRAIGMAVAAEQACPQYRVNMAEITSFSEEMHFDPEDMNKKYSAFRTETSAMYASAVDKSRNDFCDMSWAIFGDHGKIAHVLERRE